MTLSEKKVRKIFDYYGNDTPIEVIATILKIRRNTVIRYLQKHGLYPRPNKQSSYAQQGVPKLVEYISENQHRQQPSPWQDYRVQIALEEGPKLVHELDKRNREIEQKDQELADSKKRKTQLTSELEEVKGETQSLKKQLDETNIEKKHLIDAFETEKREKEQLQKTVNELKDEKLKMEQKHPKELAEQKTTIEKTSITTYLN
jgi:chromosome segregation ATPase